MPIAKARASPKNTRRIIAILFSADVMAVAIRRQAKTPTPPKRQNRSPNSSVRFSIDVYDRAFLPKPGRQYGPSTRTVGYRLNNAFNRQWQIAENDFSGNYRTFAAGEHDGDLDQPGVFHVLHPGHQCHGQSSGRPRPDRFEYDPPDHHIRTGQIRTSSSWRDPLRHWAPSVPPPSQSSESWTCPCSISSAVASRISRTVTSKFRFTPANG